MHPSMEQVRELLVRRRRLEIIDKHLTRAAVLVAMFRKHDAWHILLTKRSDEVEHHKGQISFPGGASDPGDKDIVSTALREAQEEIGLTKTSVEVLGCYDDHVTPTGFVMTPVIGYMENPSSLSPRKEEVDEIIETPVSLFLSPSKERVVEMERMGKKVDVYFYDFGKHEIWGATARISRDFLREVVASRIPL